MINVQAGKSAYCCQIFMANIEEGNEEEEFSQGRSSFRATTPPSEYTDKRDSDYTQHNPTPLNDRTKPSSKKTRQHHNHESNGAVLCNKCRPSNREKISVVPLENNNGAHTHRLSIASPKWDFQSAIEKKVIDHFLVLVSESRSTVRVLGRLYLSTCDKWAERYTIGSRSFYSRTTSRSRFPETLGAYSFYLEALLNRAFFRGFRIDRVPEKRAEPDPQPGIDRCESNFAMFARLQGLTWDEVLNKGTRHFSEDFSKFCDRKMSEIVAMLG
ncbi:hypothetical protein DH2020_005367 [Rehmannia glutinosa]|uniref:Uncharacterized protein n=1 Tax=Rehmannia glutinosa TaxID=99300 RepID=A0ABR0XGC5_REHGL